MVSGRAPALPEDMTNAAARAIGVEHGFGAGNDEAVGLYVATANAALHAAGVPGLVQRLTEAEERSESLAGTVIERGKLLGRLMEERDEAKRLLESVTDALEDAAEAGWPEGNIYERIARPARAFLSVGEGRSREGAGETDE